MSWSVIGPLQWSGTQGSRQTVINSTSEAGNDAFARIDADGSGGISREEFEKVGEPHVSGPVRGLWIKSSRSSSIPHTWECTYDANLCHALDSGKTETV